jgi:hypothetical protein
VRRQRAIDLPGDRIGHSCIADLDAWL